MIDTLQAVSSNSNQLQEYLSLNFQEVYDYFTNEKHSVLQQKSAEINQYILFKIQVLRELNFENNTHLAFLTLLLDISERFGFLNAFKSLYDILQRNIFDIGKRLEAASLYLIGINTVDDYLSRFDRIYSLLQIAFETEEDRADRVLTTMLNYYAQMIYNFEFNSQAAMQLREKIVQCRSNQPNSFLQHELVEQVLNIPLVPHDKAFQEIHQSLDAFLGRDIIRLFSNDVYLIEESTQYAFLLGNIEPDFIKVRELSTTLYLPVQHDSIFHSLQRGVKILEDENQLFAYMYSYGKMHHAKLISAFEYLPVDFFTKTIRVIDWGCGQGMATMVYLDYLKGKQLTQDIRHVTLIEPSKIAIKRATLHSNKFSGGNNISTLNKDLDSLNLKDFRNSIPSTKLHLFSNILDIDLFSLSGLINNIEKAYAGENYFVCVSPYVNDLKNSRMDTFVNHFSSYNEFELLAFANDRNGEWKNNWSRVIRVFKCKI